MEMPMTDRFVAILVHFLLINLNIDLVIHE